jgi:hypothetical protein
MTPGQRSRHKPKTTSENNWIRYDCLSGEPSCLNFRQTLTLRRLRWHTFPFQETSLYPPGEIKLQVYLLRKINTLGPSIYWQRGLKDQKGERHVFTFTWAKTATSFNTWVYMTPWFGWGQQMTDPWQYVSLCFCPHYLEVELRAPLDREDNISTYFRPRVILVLHWKRNLSSDGMVDFKRIGCISKWLWKVKTFPLQGFMLKHAFTSKYKIIKIKWCDLFSLYCSI